MFEYILLITPRATFRAKRMTIPKIVSTLTLLLWIGGMALAQTPIPGDSVPSDFAPDDLEFIDHFDDNRHQWPELTENNRKTWFEEGAYLIKGKSVALPIFASVSIPLVQTDSFVLETVITQLDGKKNMGYGLCWGSRIDRRDCYVFLLSSNKKFTILRMERGRYRLLQPWTKTDLIAGPKEENTLTVIRKDDVFYYLINGQKVFVGSADPLKGTFCGVLMHGTQELKVDEFSLTFPEEE